MMRNKQLVTELVVDECLVGMPLKTRENHFLYPSRQPYWAFGVGIEIGKLRSGLLRVEGRIDNWMKLGRRRSATQMTMHNSGCAKEEGYRAPHRLLFQPGHTTTKPCISLSRVATNYQVPSQLSVAPLMGSCFIRPVLRSESMERRDDPVPAHEGSMRPHQRDHQPLLG